MTECARLSFCLLAKSNLATWLSKFALKDGLGWVRWNELGWTGFWRVGGGYEREESCCWFLAWHAISKADIHFLICAAAVLLLITECHAPKLKCSWLESQLYLRPSLVITIHMHTPLFHISSMDLLTPSVTWCTRFHQWNWVKNMSKLGSKFVSISPLNNNCYYGRTAHERSLKVRFAGCFCRRAPLFIVSKE